MESTVAMLESEQFALEGGRARLTLLRRLSDVVSLPASRINAFERSVVADLLIDVLRQAKIEERRRVAARLAVLTEIPNNLCRMILRDDIVVAKELIDECASLSDHDLIECIRDVGVEHCAHIAMRRGLSEAVSNALIKRGEPQIIMSVLSNVSAAIPTTALEAAVALSRNYPELCASILKRAELRPSSAYVMYWWCRPDERSTILRRFAVSREILQSSTSDLFSMMGAETHEDPVVRRALQFIERRQRDREAAKQSEYQSLEGIIEVALKDGMNPDIVSEISALAGIKPLTAAKILSDEDGESLAVLAKATGLTKHYLIMLWRALRRSEMIAPNVPDPRWARVQITYEMLAVERAQTVLRYWNWALTSALTPELIRAIREGDEHLVDAFSAAERAAMLALAQDLRA